MSQTKQAFDFEAAVRALQDGQDLNGKNGILAPLIKQITEAALQAELEQHLASQDAPNRKNGRSTKKVKALSGELVLETPRGRAGTFEPQLVGMHQRYLTDELERKILSLFAQGMSYQAEQEPRDILPYVSFYTEETRKSEALSGF